MAKQSRVAKLFKALEEGKILCKIHNEDLKLKEFLIYDKKHKMLEVKGWASALGQSNERLRELLDHPENWYVHSHVGGHPYPWSIGYKGV